MEELIQPSFHTRPYMLKDVVFIFDRWQQFVYLREHMFPVDMYVSTDNNLVMVFKKDETREIYYRYRNREFQP